MITLPGGRRKRLPPFPKGTSEAAARDKTAYFAEHPELLPSVARAKAQATTGPVGETEMDRWVKLWIDDKKARGQTATRDAATHYRLHIRPKLSTHVKKDLDKQTSCGVLSHESRSRAQGGELAWKSAQNVWNTVTKMCDDATKSKRDDLRCREGKSRVARKVARTQATKRLSNIFTRASFRNSSGVSRCRCIGGKPLRSLCTRTRATLSFGC